MDYLVFSASARTGAGTLDAWPEGEPEEAYFVCSRNGCVIEHKHKRDMVERGEWRASEAVHGARVVPHLGGVQLQPERDVGTARARVPRGAKGGPEKLKTFVNTVLGETWQERGDAPDWERLYNRRENYEIGTVPEGVRFLTAGVDVQKDRFVYEVVGWARTKSHG
jgi:phage terminase large subunit GpA-like protein